MRVSLVSPVLRPPDGISYAALRTAEALGRIFGGALEYRIYCQTTSLDDATVKRVKGPVDLLMDPFFCDSDLIVYQFGNYDRCFDSVFALPAKAQSMALYHGITPARFFQGSERAWIEKGERQKANLWACGAVACTGEHGQRELLAMGMPKERVCAIGLPLKDAYQQAPGPAAGRALAGGEVFEMLFVGRFVPSKGMADAVRAAAMAQELGAGPCRISFIGAADFGDRGYEAEVKLLAESLKRPGLFRWVGEVSEDRLRAEYLAAHVLLLPSYHEGFCLPILEAMASGCLVAGYDAANVPHLVRGLAALAPEGDWPRLAEKLAQLARGLRRGGNEIALDAGPMSAAEASAAGRRRAADFHFDRFCERLKQALGERLGLPS